MFSFRQLVQGSCHTVLLSLMCLMCHTTYSVQLCEAVYSHIRDIQFCKYLGVRFSESICSGFYSSSRAWWKPSYQTTACVWQSTPETQQQSQTTPGQQYSSRGRSWNLPHFNAKLCTYILDIVSGNGCVVMINRPFSYNYDIQPFHPCSVLQGGSGGETTWQKNSDCGCDVVFQKHGGQTMQTASELRTDYFIMKDCVCTS